MAICGFVRHVVRLQRTGEHPLLIVPPIHDRREVSGLRKAAPGNVVQCPLLDGGYLDEGVCYDFQAAAQGAGGQGYREGMLQKYASKFEGHPVDLMRKCLRHQITLVSAGGYPANYLSDLQEALKDLD
jgi:hypothetical protein